MTRRTEMLGSTIQREIALMIQRDIDDPRLPSVVSVTRVKIAPDLSVADVFVTIMGTPGQQTAALNALKHSAGMLRGKLTKSLSLRVAPYIKFNIDDKLPKELEMLSLLQKVADEQAEAERRRRIASGEITEDADEAEGDQAPEGPEAVQSEPTGQPPQDEQGKGH
jgi:ribosome-binding factor A